MLLSFAQNLEDVMLWRCFGNQPGGFYVDVGAASPINNSVTHLFYERGWSGLNLDPIPERVAELRRLRPRDRTLRLAVGARRRPVRLLREPGMGGLSTIKHVSAAAAKMEGAWEVEAEEAPLSEVLEQEGVGAIDFLKIDAEGSEAEVLAGLDLRHWRPAVILLEATLPVTTTPSHTEWEPDLLAQGYRFVWFDGLNRFYLAEERSELTDRFATPPNVHDGYARFAGLGYALYNEGHPDHIFAVHFALKLLRAPGIETDEFLEQVMRQDRPPALFDTPVTDATAAELYILVLARRPSAAELSLILAETPSPTGAALLRRLLIGDEFRNRRSRLALG